MVWLYVPGSACSTRECAPASNFLAPDTAPFATSKGKPMSPASLSRAWRTAPWMKRLSGLTCSPSTAALGAASWIASLRVSRASLTASPASALASTTSAGYGLTSPESFARLVPGWSGWRTSPDLFQPEGLPVVSKTFPRSGSMRNGECWQRPMLEPATDASDCSFWPTADTNPDGRNNRSASPNAAQRPTLAYAAKQWLTPHGMSGMDKTGKIGAGGEFQKQVENWATPNAHDGRRPGADMKSTQRGNLNRDAAAWATPLKSDGGANSKRQERGAGGPNLLEMVKTWPTPAARDSRGENSEDHLTNGSGRLHLDQLPNFVRFRFSLPAQPTTDGSTSSPNTRNSRQRLNPAFACWLMGWPWWWTNPEPISFARSEMASYRFRLQLHLSSLLGAQDWHRDRDAA